MEKSFIDFKEMQAKMQNETVEVRLNQLKEMQESQNFVLKDIHERSLRMQAQIDDIEKVDLQAKFNAVTRRAISEVCREHLTPIEMNFNLEMKAIKKIVEEHQIEMETFKDALKMFRESLDQFKLSGIYDLQNNKKVADGYLRELLRM